MTSLEETYNEVSRLEEKQKEDEERIAQVVRNTAVNLKFVVTLQMLGDLILIFIIVECRNCRI